MRKLLIPLAGLLVALLAFAPQPSAIDKVDTNKLRKAVTVDGILEHERALQDIAIANDGTRVAMSPGQDCARRLRR